MKRTLEREARTAQVLLLWEHAPVSYGHKTCAPTHPCTHAATHPHTHARTRACIYLSSVCLSTCPPTCPPVHLSTCPPVHPPVHLSTCPPACPPVHLPVDESVSPPTACSLPMLFSDGPQWLPPLPQVTITLSTHADVSATDAAPRSASRQRPRGREHRVRGGCLDIRAARAALQSAEWSNGLMAS